MDTICLDRTTWDLFTDASGNIALATEPYSIAQDVATAVRTFLGDCYYNTALGVPYFEQILGQWPPLQLVKAQVVAAALTVPDVVQAQCLIASANARSVTGLVEVIDTTGQTLNVSF